MQHFSAALNTWLKMEQPQLSLRQLAALADLNDGDLSRIRGGTKTISFTSITKLLGCVRSNYGLEPAVRLLIAYLWDEVPATFHDTVTIEAKGSDVVQETPDSTPPLEAALEYFRQRAHRDSETAEWLIQLHTMVTHRHPETEVERRLVKYRSSKPKDEPKPPTSQNQNVIGSTVHGGVRMDNRKGRDNP